MTIKEICKPVEPELKELNKFIREMMNTDIPMLNLIIKYIAKKKGKQVRPALVLLSAQMCGGINKRTYTGAAMVELLHTATLTHDDVVDEASERRGMPTINVSWNNKIAVLIGDFLLAKGLLAAIDNDEFNFLKATSLAVRRMSEGELLQIQKSKEINLDEETYFTIISNKTASLMASCCEIGAISATDDKNIQLKLREFGELIGIAFQIKDDIFDYQSKNKLIGKPVANDLKEKKMTLPLLYSFKQVSKKESKRIIKIIKKGNLKKIDIAEIIEFVNINGGIKYAEKISMDYSKRALDILKQFDDCSAKESLIDLTRFVVNRTN